MPRGKKKDGKSNKIYFGDREERAVEEYLTSTDEKEKERIFTEILYPALSKLVECVINRYKLYPVDRSYETIMQDALSDLVEKFKKFKPDKNKKAFSYFGTVCKHYAQNECEKAKKNVVKTMSFNDGRDVEGNGFGMSCIDEFDMTVGSEDDMYRYIEQKTCEERSLKSRYSLVSSADDGVEREMDDEEDEAYVDDNFADRMIFEMVGHMGEMMKEPETYKLTDKDIQVGTAITMLLNNWESIYMDMCNENNCKNVSKKFAKNSVMYYLSETACVNKNELRKSLKKYKTEYYELKKKVVS